MLTPLSPSSQRILERVELELHSTCPLGQSMLDPHDIGNQVLRYGKSALPVIRELLELVERQRESLVCVERFVRVAGESSHEFYYENACLEHAKECVEALVHTDEVLNKLGGAL